MARNVYHSFVHVFRSGDLVPWTLHIRHNIVSILVTVCPSQSYVHGFLGLTSTRQGVNVTCSRSQRLATRPGLEPGTPWSVVRGANHCASPPHPRTPPPPQKKKSCSHLAAKYVKVNPGSSFEQIIKGKSPQCYMPSFVEISLLVLETKNFEGFLLYYAK